MKSLKSCLFGISLMVMVVGYPLQGNQMSDSSAETLLHIVALNNKNKKKAQKKHNIVTRMYHKAQKIAQKPYAKRLFYAALGTAIFILATYEAYKYGVL